MVKVLNQMTSPTAQEAISPDAGSSRLPEERNTGPQHMIGRGPSGMETPPAGRAESNTGQMASNMEGAVGGEALFVPNGSLSEQEQQYQNTVITSSVSNDTITPQSSPSETYVRRRRHSSGEATIAERRRSRSTLQVPDSPGVDWLDSTSHNHFQFYPRERESPVDGEVASEGRDLFLNFLRDEIERRRLRAPRCLTPDGDDSQREPSPLRRILPFQHDLRILGRELRQLADAFAESEQRKKVRERAERLQLQSLDFQSFMNMLVGLFEEGGVTWERVVLLFFFCSDVAIMALKRKIGDVFHQLIEWSLSYIMGNLSAWVVRNGGWAAVLSHSVNTAYKLAVIGVCIIGMVAMAVYIKKNWK